MQHENSVYAAGNGNAMTGMRIDLRSDIKIIILAIGENRIQLV